MVDRENLPPRKIVLAQLTLPLPPPELPLQQNFVGCNQRRARIFPREKMSRPQRKDCKDCKRKSSAICPPTLPINFLVGNTARQEGVVKVTNSTENNRMFRNGVSTTCTSVKTCPGPFPATVPFSALEFNNPGRKKACVTITVTNLSFPIELFSHAHLKYYDPKNICKNYLGDAGLSPRVASYQISLPEGAKKFVIVLEGVSQGVLPAFGYLTISGLACQSPSAVEKPAIASSTSSTSISPPSVPGPVPGPGNDLKISST